MKYYILIFIFLLNITGAIAQTYELDVVAGDTTATCSGKFFDSGGENGNYGNAEDYLVSFTGTGNEPFAFEFYSCRIGLNDTLRVFAGSDTTAVLTEMITNTDTAFTLIEPDTLTFHFVSNASGTYNGWEAEVSCLSKGTFSNGNGGGGWNDGSSWYGTTVPSDGDTAIVLLNDTIRLNDNRTIHAMRVRQGGVLDFGSNSLEIKGDFDLKGSFLGLTELAFTGTSDQILDMASEDTLSELLVDKSSGNLLAGQSMVVSDTLKMLKGLLDLEGDTLTLGSGSGSDEAGGLNWISGRIEGNFRRWINQTNRDYLFPLGTKSYKRFAVFNFSDLNTGMLNSEFIAEDPGSDGLPVHENDTLWVDSVFTEGYWRMKPSNGLNSFGYSLRLEGEGFTSYVITPGTRVIKRPDNGSSWMLDGTHLAAVGDTVKREGLSGFSEFAMGDTLLCPLTTADTILGQDTVCATASGIQYVTNGSSGSSYEWIISGGTVASGQGNDTVYVDWGITGMTGSVQVIEDNGCRYSDTITREVVIHDLPTVSLSSLDSVYDIRDAVDTLQGNPVGGTFSGPGMTDTLFDPGTAGGGSHTIFYEYTDTNSCINVDSLSTDVYNYDHSDSAIWISDAIPWCSDSAKYTNAVNTSGDGPTPSGWSEAPGNNVWFRFTASTNAVTVKIKTGNGAGTMQGQQIAIWNSSMNEVKSIESGNNFQGELYCSIDTLTAGNTYWISVDDRDDHGTFTICVDDSANYDYKSGAYHLNSIDNWSSDDAEFSTAFATSDESSSNCNSAGPNQNVWFHFEASTHSVTATLKTGAGYGSMQRGVISIWNANGDLVKCKGPNGTWNWQGTVVSSIDTLTPGNDYWISVDYDSNYGGNPGSFTLSVDDQPTYDYWSGAKELTDITHWDSPDADYSTLNATPDGPSSSCNASGPNNNVWFKFQATTNAITIDVNTGDTLGTLERQTIALFDSDSNLVKCANTGGTWDWQGTVRLSSDSLTAGEWYYFTVDHVSGYGGEPGSFSLYLDNEPTYDYKSGAFLLEDISNWCSDSASFSNINATPDETSTHCNTSGPNANVWFEFQANTNAVTIDLKTGNGMGTMERGEVALWDSTGNLITCKGPLGTWDWQGTITLSVDTLEKNEWYYVTVDNYTNYGGSSGSFTLCLDDQPSYDYPSGAIDLIDLNNWCSEDAAYSTSNASPDGSQTSCNGTGPNQNVWFKFNAPTNAATFKLKTGDGYGTMERGEIALWDSTGKLIKCKGPNGTWGWQGTILLSEDTLTPGDLYYVSVDHLDNYNGRSGSFTLCARDAPAFDEKSAAQEIPLIDNWCSSNAAFSTVNATPDGPQTTCNSTGPNNNVWFKFQAPTNSVTIDLKTGSGYGTMERGEVALWDSNGNLIKCKGPNGTWSWQGTVSLSVDTLSADSTYFISVDHYSNYDGQRGSFTLCIDDAPAYDERAGAIELTDLDSWCSVNAQYNTNNASPDGPSTSCNTTGPNSNVWFKFHASTNSITIDLKTGSSYGTMERGEVALWDSTGNLIKCKGPNGTWSWQGTVTISVDTLSVDSLYYISVDHFSNYDGQRGSFSLCLDDEPTYDFKSGALVLNDIDNWQSPDAAYSNVNATPDESSTSCNPTGPNKNVWFTFQATTSSATVKVLTGDGTYGSMERQEIALWDSDGELVKCKGPNGTWSWQGTNMLSIDTLTKNEWYYISVDHFDNYDGAPGTFTLYVDDGPAYDFKSGALELTNLDSWCSADAAYTTVDASPDEPATSCNSNGPNKNVWYRFKALSDTASITVHTGGSFGSMERQQINLWNASGNAIHCVGPPSGEWSWTGSLNLTIDTLTPGNWYWISVDHLSNYDGQAGTFTLCIDNTKNTYYSINSGDWDNPANWSKISHTGPPASTYPGVGDAVYIRGHEIAVMNNDTAAAVYMTVADNSTRLLLEDSRLEIDGKMEIINNGENYEGRVVLNDTSVLNIYDNLEMTRNGGNQPFSMEISQGSKTIIGKDFDVQNDDGSTHPTELVLRNTASLEVIGDFRLSHAAGPRIYVSLNDTSVVDANGNIALSTSSPNTVEIDAKDTSSVRLARNFLRGTPKYGIVSFNAKSTLVLNGESYLQSLASSAGDGGDSIRYQNIIVNNTKITSPQVTLGGPVFVNGNLYLKDGIVGTSSSNLLTLGNTATLKGGSDTSFVGGPMKKIGNTAFTFPVGDGDNYQPISISAPGSSTDAYTAEYIDQDPDDAYSRSLKDSSLDNISSTEYWSLERTSGSAGVFPTIGWNNQSECIYNIDSIRMARWNGSQWANYGNSTTTGTESEGTLSADSTIQHDTNILTYANVFPPLGIKDLASDYCNVDSNFTIRGVPGDGNGTFSGFGITDNGDGTATFNPKGGSGEETIVYSYSQSGCSNQTEQDINIHSLPTSTVLGGDSICEGSTVELSVYFTGSSPWDFKYTNGRDTISSITSNNPYTFETSESGRYRVLELQDAKGCIAEDFGDTAEVGIYEVDTPSVSVSGPTTFCEGGNVGLTSSSADQYYWSTGDNTQTIFATEPGDYYVRTVTKEGCVSENSDPVSVTVKPLPFTPGIPKGDEDLCAGLISSEYTTSGALYAEPDEYRWDLNPDTAGTVIGTSTSVNIQWNEDFSGNARLSVQGHNNCGYGPKSDSILISVNAAPSVDIGPDTTACPGYILDADNAGADYYWNTGATTQTISVNNAGTYDVTVTSSNGCKGYDTTNVLISEPTPKISITPDSSVCYGSDTLHLEVSGDYDGFNWTPGDSLINGDSAVYNPNYYPRANPMSVSKTLSLSVRVTDSLGCQATDDIEIEIFRRPETGNTYHVPNDFDQN